MKHHSIFVDFTETLRIVELKNRKTTVNAQPDRRTLAAIKIRYTCINGLQSFGKLFIFQVCHLVYIALLLRGVYEV